MDNFTQAKEAIAGSAWVKFASTVSTDVAIFRNAQGAMDISGGAGRIVGQFELGLVYDTTTGALQPMAAVGIGPNVARVTAPSGISANVWHNLAFSADGAQLRLYVDGVEAAGASDYQAEINSPGIPWISIGVRLGLDTSDPPVLGPDTTDPNWMAGQLDDLGLWTRALTVEEVTKIYQAGQQGKSLDTVVITPPVTEQSKLTATISGGNIVVGWAPAGGHLESSPALGTGAAWTSVGTANPATIPTTGAAQFFRVVNP